MSTGVDHRIVRQHMTTALPTAPTQDCFVGIEDSPNRPVGVMPAARRQRQRPATLQRSVGEHFAGVDPHVLRAQFPMPASRGVGDRAGVVVRITGPVRAGDPYRQLGSLVLSDEILEHPPAGLGRRPQEYPRFEIGRDAPGRGRPQREFLSRPNTVG